MNRNLSIPLIASAAVLLLGSAFPAHAASTEQEVTQARADCHAHKMRVKELEASSAKDDGKLKEERAAWVHSCGQASQMMNGGSGNAAPPAASAPADAPGVSAEPKAP